MLRLPFFPARSRDAILVPIRTFESATAEVIAEPPRPLERGTIHVLALMIVASLAFMCFVKLDRIVKAPGRLLPIAGTLTVQPMQKSIIKQVLVSPGDVVKKGQILALCDPTFADADLTKLKQKVASLEAQVERMQTEDAGADDLPDGGKNSYDTLQASILGKRRVGFKAGVSDFDQRIIGTEATLDGLQKSIPELKSRLEIARKQESIYGDLFSKNYVSELDNLTYQDKRVQLENTLSQAISSRDSAVHTLAALKQQREQFIQQWNEDNLDNLAQTRDELDAARQELAKAQKLTDLVNLTAPEDAIVVRVPALTTGSIAQETMPMFSLVPVNAPLEVAVQIAAQDIGFVNVGDPVTIKFDAYKFLEHGTGEGVVKTISEDSFADASATDAPTPMGAGAGGAGGAGAGQGNDRFFAARITIKSIKLHDLPPNFRISPGMTLESDITVGRRTIIWYLLGSALRSGAEAIKEP